MLTVAIVATAALGLIAGYLINVYTSRAPAIKGVPIAAHPGSRAWTVALPLATAAVFSLISWRFFSGWWVVIPLSYAAVLLLISVNDIKYKVVTPKVINIALVAALVASFLCLDYWQDAPAWPGAGFASAAFGMAMGAFILLLPHVFTGGRGIGFGDVMIGAFIGAALGFPLVIIAILIGWAGGICAVVATIARRKRSPIPFGPALASGAFITLLWGPQIYHCFF